MDSQLEQNEQPKEQQEPTIIFLFDMKNWYETITPLSKLDLIDIAPLVSSQFYIDYAVKAYVLILTKSKWDVLDSNMKKKFMFVSCRIKCEMEGVMSASQREKYENSDIFELLMSQSQPVMPDTTSNTDINNLNSIKEESDDENIIVPELI